MPAVGGALLGCAVVWFGCLLAGLQLLLLTAFGVLLAISGCIAVGLTLGIARVWRRAFSHRRAILLMSAVLTVAIFAAFPVYFFVMNSVRGHETGAMFG